MLRRTALLVAGEVLGERVAEAHVHGALDLALASSGLTALPTSWTATTFSIAPLLAVHDHELGREGEDGVDDRVLEAFVERVGPVDAVLALVVHARPAAVLVSAFVQASDDRAGAHDRAPRTGRLAGAELTGGVDDDPHQRGVDAELLDGDLAGDGVHALAHLGPAVADLDRRRPRRSGQRP